MTINEQFTAVVTGRRHTCTECRNELPDCGDSRRATRVTCSAKCRKRRERRQKDAHSAWILAQHELQKMRDSIKRGEQVVDLRNQLIRLRDEINDLLLLANESNAVQRLQFLSDWKIRH
jgi:uncharacterized protein YdcH (DUF465 family)